MDHTPEARIFALPCGADYPAELIAGLEARLPNGDPLAMARTTILVNSGRLKRRLRGLFDAGPPRLLPRMLPVSDIADMAGGDVWPTPIDPLHQKLELAELLRSLIENSPGLAPRHAVFDLAESLTGLIDEMHGEGVGPDRLSALDVGDFATHWQMSREIVEAAFTHFGLDGDEAAGGEARRRLVVEALARRWTTNPPAGHIVMAGSTGSRGATRLLMEAVARLPNGYVVVPGFDFEQPTRIWNALETARGGEDHPQFRFHRLMTALGLRATDVIPWTSTDAPAPERNRLVSLALRPAPVTDEWRQEGQDLRAEIPAATDTLTLLQAPTQHAEAGAIALRLRQAVHEGRVAALITPDRGLTRRVASALQRWGIEPDDSAGEPLHQTAPGRFLRHVAHLLDSPPDLPALLVLLKHPLTASTEGRRGPHLRWTRELELHLRRHAVAFPGGPDIVAWSERRQADDGRRAWADWLGRLLDGLDHGTMLDIGDQATRHLTLAEAFAAGPGGDGSGALWEERPGEAARTAMNRLRDAAGHGGTLTCRDYNNLLRTHLSGESVQDPRRPHPDVMIWGTLEARSGGADLAVLAGLNDGTWPDLPSPDTWLNRQMRNDAGLLSPDRRIGLAAHDFQQAIAAPEILLTRALRDEDAETIPSRWLNRLTNLLGGLGEDGKAALEAMAARGDHLLRMAAALDRPTERRDPEPRPSPCPPVHVRPRQLAVTRITQLIRDPYAVYAAHILKLRPLAPLVPRADARLRGIALHRIIEEFVAARDEWYPDRDAAFVRLSGIAQDVLAADVPSVAMRAFWHARLMAIADHLVDGELQRQSDGTPVLTERHGALGLDGLDFRLTAKPDRIDRLTDGSYAILDYKSGTPPSKDQVKHFDKQLPLEAALLERGGFEHLPEARVSILQYLSLGGAGRDRVIEMEDDEGRLPDIAWARLHDLVRHYADPANGYTSIRAAETTAFEGDYDHLARFGEWDLSQTAAPVAVGTGEGTP